MSGKTTTIKPVVNLTATEELRLMCGLDIPRWGGFNIKGKLVYVGRTRSQVIAQFEKHYWAGYWRDCYRRGCRIIRIGLIEHEHKGDSK